MDNNDFTKKYFYLPMSTNSHPLPDKIDFSKKGPKRFNRSHNWHKRLQKEPPK